MITKLPEGEFEMIVSPVVEKKEGEDIAIVGFGYLKILNSYIITLRSLFI